MPVLLTTNFGLVSFSTTSVFQFPAGLPGFENQRRFIPVQIPRAVPIVFLQSVDDPALCFTTLPVLAVDQAYRLRMTEADLEVLGLPNGRQPKIGEEVLCLSILSTRENGVTANLLAPVVVNLKNQTAVQAVMETAEYSHQHHFLAVGEPVCS